MMMESIVLYCIVISLAKACTHVKLPMTPTNPTYSPAYFPTNPSMILTAPLRYPPPNMAQWFR
jgi:hypothetical protein